jgi:hypothetical protein
MVFNPSHLSIPLSLLGFSGIKLPPVTLALALAELARLSPLLPLLLAGVLAGAAQPAVAAMKEEGETAADDEGEPAPPIRSPTPSTRN